MCCQCRGGQLKTRSGLYCKATALKKIRGDSTQPLAQLLILPARKCWSRQTDSWNWAKGFVEESAYLCCGGKKMTLNNDGYSCNIQFPVLQFLKEN